MFSTLKNAFSSFISHYSQCISSIFSRKIDNSLLEELKIILLKADTGVKTTQSIINHLQQQYTNGTITTGDDARLSLHSYLMNLLNDTSPSTQDPSIILLVGINGSGKTTFAGKLAYTHAHNNKKVLLAAADTFRAAAQEQLAEWAIRSGVDIIMGAQSQDPASVVFQAGQKFIDEEYDTLIIDTAGRLQTKINLMKELEKIKRVLNRTIPSKSVTTLLTIDASLGQNSLAQARIFHESTPLDGLILTKTDGTSKGGIIFSIAHELKLPVYYISYGEKHNDYAQFDSKSFIDKLLNI